MSKRFTLTPCDGGFVVHDAEDDQEYTYAHDEAGVLRGPIDVRKAPQTSTEQLPAFKTKRLSRPPTEELTVFLQTQGYSPSSRKIN